MLFTILPPYRLRSVVENALLTTIGECWHNDLTLIPTHNGQSPLPVATEHIPNPVSPDFSMLDTRAIQRLGSAASSLHLIGYGTYKGTQSLQNALPLLPLVQSIGSVAPERVDIHPYIDDLREVSGPFNFLYALTRPSEKLREAFVVKAGNKIHGFGVGRFLPTAG